MRTNRIISLFYLVTAAFVLCNCSKNDDIEIINPDAGPDPESGNTSLYTKHDETEENYTVSYKYNTDVVVLTQARQESYLVKVEADTILYFAGNTPVNLLPEVGGLYSSEITDKLPYGLGNKVVSRAKEGDLYKIVTTSARLDEIFDELVWDAAIEMSSLNPVYTDSLGNVIETMTAWYDAETDSCYTDAKDAATRGIVIGGVEVKSFPIPKMSKTGACIEGNFNCGAKVHCSGNIATGTFVFYMEPLLNMEVTVQSVSIDNEKTKPKRDKFFLFKGQTPAIAPITIGPIVLKPFVGVECSAEVEASGTFGVTFGKTLSGRFGFWQNNPNKHYENTTPRANNNIFRNITLAGKVEPSITAKFVFGCGLYTEKLAITLDPYLKTSVGAEFAASAYWDKQNPIKAKPEAFFKVSAGAEGELRAELFGKAKWKSEIKLVETDLFAINLSLIPSPSNQNVLRIDFSGVMSHAKVRAQDRSESPKYQAKFSLDSGLLTKFNEFYPALLVYQGDKLLSQEKLSRRYVADQSDNTFEFGVYDIRLNQEYQFMPSVYYDGDYIPLDTIVYIDEVKALTGEVKSVKETSATVECTFTNLPSWVEAGVKVWSDGDTYNYTTYSNQNVSGENTTRSYALTGLNNGKVYNYCAYIRDENDYFEGEVKTIENGLREQLIQFFESTNGKNWTRKDNWCTNEPIETWYGVSCRYDENAEAYDYSKITINLPNNNLKGDGYLQNCTALEELNLRSNQLTSLEVSGCTSLVSLDCCYNQLTSLDMSACTSLKSMGCYYNQLTSLDVSGCTALELVNCKENQLTSLNVSPSTRELYCANNRLTKLDVSWSALEELWCENNQLTRLDVSGCWALKSFDCSNNQLTSLDVSGCMALMSLNCSSNRLTGLDVCYLTALESLDCQYNRLTDLLMGGCTALRLLCCFNNQLTYLYLSDLPALESLDCENNHINQEIPLSADRLNYFGHDVKYVNYKYEYFPDIQEWMWTWTTCRYGWWYPGEPDSHYHGRSF